MRIDKPVAGYENQTTDIQVYVMLNRHKDRLSGRQTHRLMDRQMEGLLQHNASFTDQLG